MMDSAGGSVGRVRAALARAGWSGALLELPQSTRTAGDAATALGCQVAQIAKSLVFKGADSGRPILVVASGVNRVNERRLADLVAEPIVKPDAEFVRQRTGFSIGGVPPLGHSEPLTTIIDQSLLDHAVIWAAAGTPNAVFRLTPRELVAMTGGQVVSIT
jgi:prolyl-tRNA editing enzyme YbaK/EbsC (Cys-tRNA(Pro) deacylase)